MCNKKWRLATAVAVVSVSLASLSQPVFAISDAEIERLKQIIQEQQRRFEEQERRLAEQERRLQEQSERIAAQERKLNAQERLSQAQGLIITEQRDSLDDLWQRFEYVGGWDSLPYDPQDKGTMTLVQGVSPKPPVPVAPGESGPQPTPPQPTPPSGGPQPKAPDADADAPESPESARPESEKPTDQLLVEAGGVLLPPGVLQIEPAIEYTFSDTDQVGINGFTVFEAIVIGQISVDNIERNIVRSSITGRLGVYDRLQVDAFIPYVYRSDTLTDGVGTADAKDIDTDGHGIGDVQFGVSYQPLIGQGSIPDIIVRTRASFPTGKDAFDIDTRNIGAGAQTVLEEAPTGSGFYSLENTATFIWTSDPVVFFAGAGYTINFEAEKNGQDIDPGDTFQFFGGINVALNERVSLNLSFTDQITDKTTVDGSRQDGTSFNDGRVVLGTSLGVSPDVSVLFAAAAGVTDEAPDFQFSVSVPITVSLF